MIVHLVAHAGDPGIWRQIFNYGELRALISNSLIAGAVLGAVGRLFSVAAASCRRWAAASRSVPMSPPSPSPSI
ncbi:hypothetical protein ACIBQ1_28660 [Nonomuraea sp. NPDC050153]|uniref:hypothetical protein n=1 Tax=Nonomuraea sp. NPDC050153 TaxID=3364359 RepID=UPI0037AEBCF4